MTDYTSIKALFEKLERGTDPEDPDYKAALNDSMVEEIKALFCECYSAADFLDWLEKHDFDLFVDYRFASKTSIEEIMQELDEGNDRPEGVYNCDLEEWQALEDEDEKRDYIENHLDCLMYSRFSGVVVVSWVGGAFMLDNYYYLLVKTTKNGHASIVAASDSQEEIEKEWLRLLKFYEDEIKEGLVRFDPYKLY